MKLSKLSAAIVTLSMLTIGLAAVVPTANAQQVTQWDQTNDGVVNVNSAANTASVFTGTEFTPTLSAVDTVQFCLESNTDAPARLAVELRTSTRGTVLATSSVEETLPAIGGNPVPSVVTFEFSSPVAVTPGQSYFLGFDTVSDHIAWAKNALPPGEIFGGDTWFREGLNTDATSLGPGDAPSLVGEPGCPGI